MRELLVGDVHAVPNELADCKALIGLICEVAYANQVDAVTFMGDQHDANDLVSTRVLAFWKAAFSSLQNYDVTALVGNHDQVTPRDRFPHAMLAYENIEVVDGPRLLWRGVCAMPFFHDPAEFLAAATALKAANPEAETLYCHQTFSGADGSFYAKDECRALDVPFKRIFSGHIHAPQVVDRKAVYVGAPRWRAKGDEKHDRFLLVVEHDGSAPVKVVAKVPTDTVCRRLYVFEDHPGAPAPLDGIPEAKRALARIRVSVHGPAAHVRERELALRAAGCLTRSVPERVKKAQVTEAEGIGRAFERFREAFVAPRGTPAGILGRMLEERLTR